MHSQTNPGLSGKKNERKNNNLKNRYCSKSTRPGNRSIISVARPGNRYNRSSDKKRVDGSAFANNISQLSIQSLYR